MSSYLLTLRKNTQTQYTRNLKKEALPVLGDKRVNQITKRDILKVLDQKALQENKPTYANQIRLTISSVFSYGVKRDLCSTNPVSNTSPYEGGNNKRSRYYREEEIIKLWKAFSEFLEPTDSVFKVLLLTGQRKSETCQMQWSQITGDTWTIPAEVTKNGKVHEVPLSKFTKGIIDNMDSKSPYVFPSPKKKGQPIKNIGGSAKKIQDNTIADFQTHDLRRTFATHCAQIGIQRNILGRLISYSK